jgi:hypothetical protein
MQPKLQKRIQKLQQKHDTEQQLEPIPPVVIDNELPKVQPFDPNQAQQLEIMREQNNVYASLCQEIEKHKFQLRNIQHIIHDIRTGDVKMEDINVPYGMGGSRHLTENHKKEFLETYMRQYQIEDNALVSLRGQLMHRGDEVGEQRLKVLRVLWSILVHQHGFTSEDLFNHCTEYIGVRKDQSDVQLTRPKNDIE